MEVLLRQKAAKYLERLPEPSKGKIKDVLLRLSRESRQKVT
jgi:hypothetical protein